LAVVVTAAVVTAAVTAAATVARAAAPAAASAAGAGAKTEASAAARTLAADVALCRFCADKTLKVDYKDQGQLKYFLTERGKIIPRRISGNCALHQRQVATAIKRARMLAILPYTVASA